MLMRRHFQLMDMLLVDIVDGVFGPGERLPSESELAEQFGSSRGVVRETIRALEERGVVTVKHGRGATVLPARTWNLLDERIVSALLQTAASTEVLGEFLECRRILEVEAAGLAATRASGMDINRLAEIYARMAAAAERAPRSRAADEVYHHSDIEFHQAIFDATGNRVLSRTLDPIQRALLAARRPLADPGERIEKTLPEHKRILAAIASRDPDEARAAMAAHLTAISALIEMHSAMRQRPERGDH
jgi:GntR family transcriptional repressor for pyruvate dehydrogenase complex